MTVYAAPDRTTAPRTAAPRVAVVIPCFDDAETLRETVTSVSLQEPCELVVVDDGSTDPSTMSLLDELRREGIHVIRQENRGTSAARMAGVRATRAPYVFPLDGDDVLVPGALAALADALDERPELTAVWGRLDVFGETEQADRRRNHALDAWRITYYNDVPYASLMRRSALDETGGWTLQGSFQDWDLWMTLAERGHRGARLDRCVLQYRVHGQRQFRRGATRHAEIYATLRSRHPQLFAARRSNWRRSGSPWRVRLTLPLVAAMPRLSQRNRHRFYTLADNPLVAAGALRSKLLRARQA